MLGPFAIRGGKTTVGAACDDGDLPLRRLASAPSRAGELAHLSLLSAHSGFFGCEPFSRANELLSDQGAAPVDWKLP
ncbi:hypothetical protein SAMN04487818_104215 [Actinokineospora terrae]|uniref:Uncharacterized protein n=1 Tax=Actinokineospora terrae TaxID=155974 RepID=A0A1H9QGE8_9PSEU|nr:hypothetical protein SAMN04487818_104215 [Actinokineospora terrae]